MHNVIGGALPPSNIHAQLHACHLEGASKVSHLQQAPVREKQLGKGCQKHLRFVDQVTILYKMGTRCLWQSQPSAEARPSLHNGPYVLGLQICALAQGLKPPQQLCVNPCSEAFPRTGLQSYDARHGSL